MTLHRKYPKSKDARKRFHRYYDAKDHDPSCRPNGSCSYCLGNRMHSTDKRKARANERLKEDR